MVGDDEAAGGLQLRALVGRAREDDDLALLAQADEDRAEQVVLEPVVQRDLRGRADERDRLRPVQPEGLEHGRVGLEVGEVVLLLEAGVAAQLAGGAVPRQALGRDRLGDDDRLRRAGS